jgi:hypothetical protein
MAYFLTFLEKCSLKYSNANISNFIHKISEIVKIKTLQKQ